MKLSDLKLFYCNFFWSNQFLKGVLFKNRINRKMNY